jgi:hypothetical protein
VPIKTESHYQLLLGMNFPMLLPLHTTLSPEQDFTDCILCQLLHVTPTINATPYQKIECFIRQKLQVRECHLLNMPDISQVSTIL